jgi:type II secretory pathway pseudopilin PulG
MAPRSRNLLVNLLVVATIVAICVALLLPATQSAREAARAISKRAAGEAAALSLQNAASPSDKALIQARYANFQQTKISPRRIIYDAEVRLVVKKVADVETEINKYLKQVDGYVAEASVDRTQGEELTGHWKLRVPVTKFDSFLDEVAKLGVAEDRRQTAQDVTEEYVDLEAQIANKKRLEERIVALLKDATGKIKDVLEVENQLSRVRGEIEQLEGRLRYLTNRTDFTTVSITAREEENYVPPAAPTFVNRIAQAWTTSIAALQTFGEQLALGTVYVFPWLAVAVAIAIPAFFYLRRRATPTVQS